MHQAFFDVFESLNRGGPGSKDSTLKALAMAGDLPDSLKILDIGSGPGQQTLDLAVALPQSEIVALDNHQPFIEKLNRRAQEAGLADRVKGRVGDMFDLDFPEESFDILWCEGAIYFIGLEQGLREWAKLLKAGGLMVITHIWKSPKGVPDEIEAIFTEQDCEFLTVEENIHLIPQDYELLGHFKLTTQDWKENFYDPMEESSRKFMDKYHDDKEAMECLQGCIQEKKLYLKYPGSYGYEFYVMRKK